MNNEDQLRSHRVKRRRWIDQEEMREWQLKPRAVLVPRASARTLQDTRKVVSVKVVKVLLRGRPVCGGHLAREGSDLILSKAGVALRNLPREVVLLPVVANQPRNAAHHHSVDTAPISRQDFVHSVLNVENIFVCQVAEELLRLSLEQREGWGVEWVELVRLDGIDPIAHPIGSH